MSAFNRDRDPAWYSGILLDVTTVCFDTTELCAQKQASTFPVGSVVS